MAAGAFGRARNYGWDGPLNAGGGGWGIEKKDGLEAIRVEKNSKKIRSRKILKTILSLMPCQKKSRHLEIILLGALKLFAVSGTLRKTSWWRHRLLLHEAVKLIESKVLLLNEGVQCMLVKLVKVNAATQWSVSQKDKKRTWISGIELNIRPMPDCHTFASYLYDSKAWVDWLRYICLLFVWQ